MDRAKRIEEITQELKGYGFLISLWHRDDIKSALEPFDESYFYNEQDIDNVCRMCEDDIDACEGINYNSIHYLAQDYFNSLPFLNREQMMEHIDNMGFIITDFEQEWIPLEYLMERTHNTVGLTKETFIETAKLYFENRCPAKVGDKYQIHYIKSKVIQEKTLISHKTYTDIIKPVSARKHEIEVMLSDKKFRKKNKDEVLVLECEMNLIKERLAPFNMEYFTDQSPLYRAIMSNELILPPTQGGIHNVVMLKI